MLYCYRQDAQYTSGRLNPRQATAIKVLLFCGCTAVHAWAMEIQEDSPRAERGIEIKGEKSSEEEGGVMSSCGARAGPQAFIPLAHARRKGRRPRSLLPFLYSPPSPPPFSFILFYLCLSSTNLSSSCYLFSQT